MSVGVLGLVEEACCGGKEAVSVMRSFVLDGPQSSASWEWLKKFKSLNTPDNLWVVLCTVVRLSHNHYKIWIEN